MRDQPAPFELQDVGLRTMAVRSMGLRPVPSVTPARVWASGYPEQDPVGVATSVPENAELVTLGQAAQRGYLDELSGFVALAMGERPRRWLERVGARLVEERCLMEVLL